MPRAPLSRRRPYPKKENRPNSAQRGYGHWWANEKRTGWADQLFARLVIEHGPFCTYCESAPAELLDHIVAPSTQGEPGSPDYERWLRDDQNVCLACGRCNRIKANLPATDNRVLSLRPRDANGHRKPLPPAVLIAASRAGVATRRQDALPPH